MKLIGKNLIFENLFDIGRWGKLKKKWSSNTSINDRLFPNTKLTNKNERVSHLNNLTAPELVNIVAKCIEQLELQHNQQTELEQRLNEALSGQKHSEMLLSKVGAMVAMVVCSLEANDIKPLSGLSINDCEELMKEVMSFKK